MRMTTRKIIVLCVLFTQSLCAPNGCLESCGSYHEIKSYRTQQTFNTKFNNHANVQDINNLDFRDDKPDNWTEQNVYRTDGGHGKVYEERGQYVQGPKRVKYFKKNYTSRIESPALIEHERLSPSLASSLPVVNGRQTLKYSESSELYRREGIYGQQHEQTYNQGSEHFSNTNRNSRVLEHELLDTDAQNLHEQNHYDETRPGNWSKVDEYKTDDGHGHVFEEKGQYVTGPKKVSYYKKNYISSYGTGSVPTSSINLNHNIESQMQTLQRVLDHHEREIHQSLQQPSSNVLQVAENTNFGHHHERTILHPYLENSYNTEQHTGTGSTKTVHQIHNEEEERLYRENQSVQSSRTAFHNYPELKLSSHDRLSNDHYDNQQNHFNNKEMTSHMQTGEYQKQFLNTHQTELIQNQASNKNSQQNIVNYPQKRGQIRHYEENWSSSQLPSYDHSDSYNIHQYRDSHSSHVQKHNIEASQSRGNRYNSEYRTSSGQLASGMANLGQGTQYTDCNQETEQIHYNSRRKRNVKYDEFYDTLQKSQSNDQIDQRHYPPELFNDHELSSTLTQQSSKQHGYKQEKPENYNQHYEDKTQESGDLEQQRSGFYDFNSQVSDKLKFESHMEQSLQSNEDLTQQTNQFDDFTQKIAQQPQYNHQVQWPMYNKLKESTISNFPFEDFTQRNKDLTQQNEDLTQQTNTFDNHRPHKLEQSLNNPKQDILFNQNSINLTRKDTTEHIENNDFNEQKPGTLEYGSQMHLSHKPLSFDANNENFKTSTQENTDFFKETGNSDFDRQTPENLEYTQQTQQPSYGINTQHSEYLPEQTNSFNSYNLEKLNHEQQYESRKPYNEQDHLQPVSLSQQIRDINQQHLEKPDHREQTEQVIYKPERSEINNKHYVDLTQHNDDITQQTYKFSDDFIDKSSEKLISGQQTQLLHNLKNPDIDKQQLENINQQNEDYIQQTPKFDNLQQVSGKLEFGQNNADEIEQVQGFDELTQQTSRKWDYDQNIQDQLHTINNPVSVNQFEDLTQQTENLEQQARKPNNLINKDINTAWSQTSRPAPKPKLKARYQKPNFSYNDQQITNSNKENTNIDIDNNKSEKIQRGDQGINIYNNDHHNYTNINKLIETDKRDGSIISQMQPTLESSTENQTHQTPIYPSVDTNLEFQYTQQSRYDQELNFEEQKLKSQIETARSNTARHSTEEKKNNYNKNAGFVKGRNKWHQFNPQLEHTRHMGSSSDNGYDSQTAQVLTSNQNFQQQQWNVDQMENSKDNANTETKLEPRILEAYGAGPYDVNHRDDIFDKVTPKPDTLLPPYLNMDSWDIREKTERVIPLPETTEIIETTTITQPRQNFWDRIGHKITNTFDKAREKAKEIFG